MIILGDANVDDANFSASSVLPADFGVGAGSTGGGGDGSRGRSGSAAAATAQTQEQTFGDARAFLSGCVDDFYFIFIK